MTFPHANIRLSFSDIQATGDPVPDFPWIRFDTGNVCYNEALIEGQWVGAGWSAMGRPPSRRLVWQRCGPPPEGQPWPPRMPWRSAFWLQVDGQLLVNGWEWVSAGEKTPRKPGGMEYEVVLQNTLRPVRACLHTRLDGTPFLARWIELENTGAQPLAVAEACSWCGKLWGMGSPLAPVRIEPAFLLGRFQGEQWFQEGAFDWQPLPAGSYGFDSAMGKSGWGSPFFILRNASSGESMVGSLAWSGNWAIQTLVQASIPPGPVSGTNRPLEVYLRAGMSGTPPLRLLAPGETASLPTFHFGFLSAGLDDCVQALHEHQRRSTVPAQPARASHPGVIHPVECNHTGYTQNAQITEDCLFREVDVAAEIGCELFVVDAGWFGDTSSSWAHQVGDWQETPLLKRGLKAVMDEIRRRGMGCGLWAEIERIVPTSRIAQAQPDWFLRRCGRPIYQLDLALPAVETHVYETIARLVETYELDCFRLDYNIAPMEGGDSEFSATGSLESTQWRYYEALYRIFDRLHNRYPDLLLENCSSGGGRTDLGMLSRFHWTQVTDQWEPQATLKIVNGMTLALPPEQVMTLLGAISFDGVSNLDFMLRIGLFSHFCVSGIYPSPEEVHTSSLERWKHATHLYKSFVRPILSESRFYHHTPVLRQGEPEEWCVLELASADRKRALLGAWRFPGAPEPSRLVFPRGLHPGLRYRVTYDNTGSSRMVPGGDLLDHGLRVETGAPGCSELLLFEAVIDE